MAAPLPMMKVPPRRIDGDSPPRAASKARPMAAAMVTDCAQSMMCRRSMVSASAPAISEKQK